jgi:hypothetical protein
LDEALEFVHSGDTFVITKLDRLARSILNPGRQAGIFTLQYEAYGAEKHVYRTAKRSAPEGAGHEIVGKLYRPNASAIMPQPI